MHNANKWSEILGRWGFILQYRILKQSPPTKGTVYETKTPNFLSTMTLDFNFVENSLRFCHRSDGRHGLEKIFQAVLCPTQLFQWKLICTFNQHCLSYKISNRLQFNSSLFFWKRFETALHWHNFFQDVLHSQKTFKYIETDTYIFYGTYSRAD